MTAVFRALILALTLAVTPVLTAAAQSDEAIVTELLQRRAGYDEARAMRDSFALMPPKVLDVMAQALGTDREGVLDQMTVRFNSSKTPFTVVAARLVPGSLLASETPDGTRYFTADIAHYFRVDQTELYRAQTLYLILHDSGQWYVTNVHSATDLLVLRRAYPAFADVTFREQILYPVPDNTLPLVEPPADPTGATP